MAYLVKTNLKTHMYGESIDEIIRGDDTIVTAAISAGIAEAKSYLNRYNLTKLFDPTATGYVADANLLNKVKDLVCWHVLALANPNINFDVFQERYQKALRWFEFVMKGDVDPDGWPYKTDNADTDYPEGGTVSMSTSTPRRNEY